MLRIENDRTRTILPIMLLAILWVAAAFSRAVLFAALAGTPLVAVLILEMYKSIRMDSRGCYVQVLFWHKFYPWSGFRTIRLLDFSKINMKLNFYGEGILFSTRKIKKYPFSIDPDSYLALTDPLCRTGFYIQFPPESAEPAEYHRLPLSSDYAYRIRREEFMSKVEEWGLKIEGLNVPMPPEQLAAKKKR